MWNAMARQRNSFLHAALCNKHVDPAVLNKCVDMVMIKKELEGKLGDCKTQKEEKPKSNWKAEHGTCRKNAKQQQRMQEFEIDKLDNFCHPGFQQPTIREPDSFGVKIFKKDARIAYGLEGLPKLIREMTSENSNIQSQAMHSLAKELLDPLKCNRAIVELQITKKCSEAMDSFYPYVPEDPSALEHLVMILGAIAFHQQGAAQILDEHQLVSCLYDMIIDDRSVSRYAAKVLKIMSAQPHVADLMASGDHVRRVIHVLNRIEVIEDVYLELANLIERSPGKALDEDCFTYLYSRLTCRDQFQAAVMKCFALLINSNEAQSLCDKVDVVHLLYEMLEDDTLPLVTLEYTSLALLGALYSTTAMWRCREFWNLPLILIKRAHTKNNASMQLWCLEALRQLTSMPSVKNFVRKSCKKRIKNIRCLSPSAENVKEQLLQWVHSKPYAPYDSEEENEIKSNHFDSDQEKQSEDEPFITEKLVNEGEEEKAGDEKYDLNAISNPSAHTACHPREIAYRLDYFPLKKTEILTDLKQKEIKKSTTHSFKSHSVKDKW